jgi:hypothetical protein
VNVILKNLWVSSRHYAGFGLLTAFGLFGVIASLILVQHGVDLSPASMM